MAEALATLTRSNDLNKEREPADLAFLALAQHRLGQSEKARTTLGRLREVMKNPQRAEESGGAGLPARGRDDRARPGLPGQPVRAVINDEAASRTNPSRTRRTRAAAPGRFLRRACPCYPILADNANPDGLILWMTYKEARALITFEARPPPLPHSPTGNDRVNGIRSASRVVSSWVSPEQKPGLREIQTTLARWPSRRRLHWVNKATEDEMWPKAHRSKSGE